MVCEKCNAEHDGSYGSGRFCSKHCAKSHKHTDESKANISAAVRRGMTPAVRKLISEKNKAWAAAHKKEPKKLIPGNCENCGKEHDGSYASGRFCGSKCSRGFATKAKRKEINEKVSKKRSALKKIIIKECLFCGASFIAKRFDRKCCNRKCAISFQIKMDPERFSRAGRASALKRVRRSKNEIAFFELCKQHFQDVENNAAIFNGWDADVIIHDIKIAILWNGIWHYKKCNVKHSLEQVQSRDRIKLKEIIKAGYTPYVIKDMGSYNKKFVESRFKEFIDEVNKQ